MPNMLDYLAWRGDLPVGQYPINENDELILSQLAYVAFGDHLPGPESPNESMALRDAVSWLVAHDPDAQRIHQTGFMWKSNLQLLRALSESERFGGMRISHYVDTVSPEDEKQFAAMTIEIGDGTTLVAFRGTDDTLVGWKEDLNMAFDCPVPAQLEAVRYLENVAQNKSGPLRVSGHSKGGNLAVYAAARCDDKMKDRIHGVVSHDGPGLDKDTICSDGYARVRDRIRVYIPHFSFVGMLLEHENNYIVVQSDAKSVLQHDAFSWQMRRTSMLYADRPSERSLHTNRVLRQWIETLDEKDQRLFVEAVYEIACATYGDTIPEDVETNWSASAQGVFSAMRKLDTKTLSLFTRGIGELFSTAIKNIRLPWQRETAEERNEELAELMDTVKLEE